MYLDHINISAAWPQLLEAKAFYETVLGLAEGERPPFSHRGFWLYANNVAIVHLVEADDRQLPSNPPHLDHFAFRCDSLDKIETILQRMNISYIRKPVPGTGLEQLFMHDPLGHRVEVGAGSFEI